MAQSTYTMNYSNFIGADMSSDPRVVSRNRLAYSVNMWRDYESEQGAAVETFPGFRAPITVFKHKDFFMVPINNMWHYKGAKHEYIIFSWNSQLVYYEINELENLKDQTTITNTSNQIISGDYSVWGYSVAFTVNNLFYVSSSSDFIEIREEKNENNQYVLIAKQASAYIPTTYYNGKPYEQRNAFADTVHEVYYGGGEEREFENLVPSYDEDGNISDWNTEKVKAIAFKINDKASSLESVLNPEVAIKSVTVGIEEYNIASWETIDQEARFYFSKDKNGNYKNEYIVTEFMDAETGTYAPRMTEFIILKEQADGKKVEITYNVDTVNFNTVGNLTHFQNDKITMAEAIFGCTKSAVYDGRVFLTGNPELPNTVFYSQRNLTGANDPTYFGVYNYFNDGDGNTPNVDLLATPSMLMVIKGDTVQDGSVYYHVGADNPHSDKSVRDLVPRIYPSTTGAAGLGSAGDTTAYSLSCNFLDDPVFLSRRGLEGVSKEQLNAERTIQHRSSNIDRLLLREDLAHASLAEWKGYLVICCNGHIYLADSRAITQHKDGSYQYEWFYLEGVGTYEGYEDRYCRVTEWPIINGVSLEDIVAQDKDNRYYLWDIEGEITELTDENGNQYIWTEVIGDVRIYYYVDFSDFSRYIVDIIPNRKKGTGKFYGAKRVLAVGELLIFATDYDICIFNTDKRGVSLKDDDGNIIREVDSDKIDPSWYSFNGVPYVSGCSIRLDDCEKKTVTKTTVYGTTVARLKMMPGSHCRITSSVNGRDWDEVGEASAMRLDFSDIRFDNFSFAENEDEIYVLPELSRGWVSKQYYFYSDGFCEPFGLYELSYNYKIAGKIRNLGG